MNALIIFISILITILVIFIFFFIKKPGNNIQKIKNEKANIKKATEIIKNEKEKIKNSLNDDVSNDLDAIRKGLDN